MLSSKSFVHFDFKALINTLFNWTWFWIEFWIGFWIGFELEILIFNLERHFPETNPIKFSDRRPNDRQMFGNGQFDVIWRSHNDIQCYTINTIIYRQWPVRSIRKLIIHMLCFPLSNLMFNFMQAILYIVYYCVVKREFSSVGLFFDLNRTKRLLKTPWLDPPWPTVHKSTRSFQDSNFPVF